MCCIDLYQAQTFAITPFMIKILITNHSPLQLNRLISCGTVVIEAIHNQHKIDSNLS